MHFDDGWRRRWSEGATTHSVRVVFSICAPSEHRGSKGLIATMSHSHYLVVLSLFLTFACRRGESQRKALLWKSLIVSSVRPSVPRSLARSLSRSVMIDREQGRSRIRVCRRNKYIRWCRYHSLKLIGEFGRISLNSRHLHHSFIILLRFVMASQKIINTTCHA